MNHPVQAAGYLRFLRITRNAASGEEFNPKRLNADPRRLERDVPRFHPLNWGVIRFPPKLVKRKGYDSLPPFLFVVDFTCQQKNVPACVIWIMFFILLRMKNHSEEKR